MNSTFVFLLSIVIILVFVSFILWICINFYNKNNVKPLLPCSEIVNFKTLVQIPFNPPDEIICEGQKGLYYIGSLGYDYVVATWSTKPEDVCGQFCKNGIIKDFDNIICNGPDYNGKTAQENFNKCMDELNTKDCIPPKPIAHQGTILYYPYSPTCCLCNCLKCKEQ